MTYKHLWRNTIDLIKSISCHSLLACTRYNLRYTCPFLLLPSLQSVLRNATLYIGSRELFHKKNSSELVGKMTLSVSLLIHIAGLIALSQLIFSGVNHEHVNGSLNGIVTQVLEGVLDAVFSALPFSSDVVSAGWLLKMLLYSAATLYILYIGRSASGCSVRVESDLRTCTYIAYNYWYGAMVSEQICGSIYT